MEKGVFTANKKDGTLYYRSSITFNNKHISLGSFNDESSAHQAYVLADRIINDLGLSIDDLLAYTEILPLDKIVSLINFRDNGLYSPNPIYISGKLLYYYLDSNLVLKFDIDDLFYYAKHKIQKRGGHLFVADCGKQINIASRYGIKNNAVLGKDYIFVNNDPTDYRYSNIQIINEYQGVHLLDEKTANNFKTKKSKKQFFKTLIHINGNFIVGIYDSKEKAAIAYNKAADILKNKGCNINFTRNVINKMTLKKYNQLYESIDISEEIRKLKF